MEALVAALGGTVWTTVFFVIGLSIIVFVHEYGHYIVGRWSGIHAEVFSIGFGPVLFSRHDRRGTRWQVAAIPFGGYVKFLGDADASSVKGADVSGLSAAERRHTMQGAPLWARAVTVLAGPVANFILAFFIFAGLILFMGIQRDELVIGKMRPFPFEGESLKDGDIILAVNGTPIPDWAGFRDVTEKLKGETSLAYTVKRGQDELVVNGPHPQVPVVGDVSIRSAALDAGIEIGDVVLKAGGRDVRYFDELVEIVTGSKGQPVPLTIWRDGKTLEMSLTPRLRLAPDNDTGELTERYLIGLGSGTFFEPSLRSATLWEAAYGSGMTMWQHTTGTFTALGKLVGGMISTCNLSGAVGMAKTMGDAARTGVDGFIAILGGLSLGIGIINLFPIPVLDGGHLVFHLYEAVTRRKPAERMLGILMTIGLVLVVSIMLFGLSRDFLCV
jgi:regulator of sigma E protease